MVLLIGNITNALLEIADPFPTEGDFNIRLEANGWIPGVPITSGQFARIAPQLLDLESRFLIYWQIDTSGRSEDVRRSAQIPWAGSIQWVTPGVLSLAATSTVITIVGYRMFEGQTVSKVTMGTGAGSVDYTSRGTGPGQNVLSVSHLKPGPSHALTVDASDYRHIIVTLATNSSGVITSTAADVVAAVNANADATFLVVASINTAGTAQAQTDTAMSGGRGPYMALTLNGYSQTYSVTRVAYNDIITFTMPQHSLLGQAPPVGSNVYLEIDLDGTIVMRIPFTVTA